MPGLLGGIARTAVIAGTATAVSNRVSRRQLNRWSRQEDEQYAQQQYQQPPPQQQQTSQQPAQQPEPAQAPPTMQAPRGGWNAANSAYSGGASGGGYYSPEGYVGASPGPGQTGYIYPNQAAATAAGDVGTGVKAPGGLSSPQAQSALSGIGSGLTQAAQAIKDSVKPWQWITPAPMGNQVAPPPAPVTLGEVRT